MTASAALDKGTLQSIRTVLEGLILAALVWAGTQLNGLAVEMAKVQTRLVSFERLETRVDEMEKRQSAIERGQAALEQRAATNSSRLDVLERSR